MGGPDLYMNGMEEEVMSAILDSKREGMNKVDISVNSSLMTVIDTRSLGAIRLLIQSGIDLRLKNYQRETAVNRFERRKLSLSCPCFLRVR
jgi:hypothetical protein